ncbi:MAG: VWA domain-containing protein [Candidatus Heimdallarchaeota archaeon]|nr:VWA domain-containing protein [Candidatus Heimdallarchaeota archaeon]
MNPIKKQITIFSYTLMIILVLLSGLSFLPAVGSSGSPVDSSEGNFKINDWDDSWVTQAQVEDFAEVLEDAYDILVGDWGFPDPMTASREPPIEITIEQQSGYNGWACCSDREKNFKMGFYPDYITGFAADHEPLKVAGHEHFHCCQFVHPGTPPADWVLEGMARMSQDKFSDWLDHADGSEAGTSFVRQSQSYLAASHTLDLTTISYSACLFWQYFCEQFGSDHTDPDYGIDAISTFWDTSVNPEGGGGVAMTHKALQTLSPGTTFEDVFEDFSVAIYTKDMNPSTVPSEWTFIDDDETDGSGDYGTVSREINPIPTLTLGSTISGSSETIDSWSNRYYEVEVDSSVEAITVEFDQITNNKLFYALLCMNGDDVIDYYTVECKEFNRAITNNGYDKICVVVAGLENSVTTPAEFDYSFAGEDPTIDIEFPKNSPLSYQARAGPHNDTEKFFAIVDVSYKSAAPVHGYGPDNFKATVGYQSATVLNAIDTYGKYILQIAAPTQPADGLYNLQIDLVDSNGVNIDSDSEEACVSYGEDYYDCMLAIDKSGSMSISGKIRAAKSASKLFTNSFLSGDQLGVVAFSTTAGVVHQLLELTSSNRSTAITKIEGITIDSLTSIGDGLQKCIDEFTARGIAEYPDHIILLSDGVENTAPYISSVLPTLLSMGIMVHVVTIGANAAYTTMQALAADTGGAYFHCFDPASGDIPNDLAEIYRGITEYIRSLERFHHERGVLPSGDSKTFELEVTDDMTMVEFVAHYNATRKPTVLELEDPSSTVISADYSNDKDGMGHAVWRINSPTPGTWRITLTADPDGSDMRYFIEGAADSNVEMDLLSPPNGFIFEEWGNGDPVGEPIPILVSLTDSGQIPDAKVSMNIVPPKTGKPNPLFRLPLFDDGNHGDGNAGDGIYGNLYTATAVPGSYQFFINATGVNSLGTPFTRIRTGAFHIYGQEIPDSDKDGLPDNWESIYGLDPYDPTGEQGATGDPDLDGLPNSEEFFWGTDPLNADTDYGGVGDGSEVQRGLNPLDPGDDPPNMSLPEFRLFPGDGHVFIMAPKGLPYTLLEIYRSTNPSFGFTPIASGNYSTLQLYNDTSAVNYNEYYYRFVAIQQATGAPDLVTGASEPYLVIPKQNVIAPEASILINDGAQTTNSLAVILKIISTKNDVTSKLANSPTHMRISDDPLTLFSQPWTAFSSPTSYTLSGGEGLKFIFIQLRDSQTIPEESPIFSAAIYYSPSTTTTPSPSTNSTVSITSATSTFPFIVVGGEIVVIAVICYLRKKKKKV